MLWVCDTLSKQSWARSCKILSLENSFKFYWFQVQVEWDRYAGKKVIKARGARVEVCTDTEMTREANKFCAESDAVRSTPLDVNCTPEPSLI